MYNIAIAWGRVNFRTFVCISRAIVVAYVQHDVFYLELVVLV